MNQKLMYFPDSGCIRPSRHLYGYATGQLRRRGIVGGVQTKPDSTSYRCFETLLIGRTGKAIKQII